MFARVLFPTDFSVYANAVFACLPELKAAGMREVVLLGVVHPNDVPLGRAFQAETVDKLHKCARRCSRAFCIPPTFPIARMPRSRSSSD